MPPKNNNSARKAIMPFFSFLFRNINQAAVPIRLFIIIADGISKIKVQIMNICNQNDKYKKPRFCEARY